MKIRPCTLKQANAFVAEFHRHHKPVVRHRFSIALFSDDGDDLLGVVITGRPVARMDETYGMLEITRCATKGTKNAISKMYGAVCKIARTMGFEGVQTYTLEEEDGASMKASGFTLVGTTSGGEWKRSEGTARRKDQPSTPKKKWRKMFPENAFEDDFYDL